MITHALSIQSRDLPVFGPNMPQPGNAGNHAEVPLPSEEKILRHHVTIPVGFRLYRCTYDHQSHEEMFSMTETPKTPGTASGVMATPDEQMRGGALEQVKVRDALHTDRGDTTIEETVVQKLAGIATREVPGVYAMGSAGRRAFSALTERIPGSQTNVSGGVTVEKGERQAAIDVSIVIDYGFSVVEVSQAIRRNIIQSVERATGLEVLEVNINVSDVHLPEEEHDDQQVQKTQLQ
jgi:uncharacterized alkaline shock family protein YloU